MVIFNHSNERGFYRYVTDTMVTPIGIWNLILSIACKSAVPIFFMISGATLLQKEESIRKTYKRIPKILFDLLSFSLLYFWLDAYLSGNEFSIKDTLQVIVQNSYWHMWYLYAYIALIITLPFLRDFIKNTKLENGFVLYIVAIIIMAVLPIFEYFFVGGINGSLKPLWVSYNIFIYPALGYFIEHKINFKSIKKKHMLLLWGINIICFAVSEVCEYFFLLKEPGNANETFLCIFCIVNAPIIFVSLKYLFNSRKIQGWLYKLIIETGKCTFGIYLLHIMFLWKIKFFYNIWVKIEQGSVFRQNVGIFLSVFWVFCLAGAVTYILRKIPLIKKMF